MELSPKQQINELVKKSQTILILGHSKINGDALGGMLALERVLTALGKNVSLVSSDSIDSSLTFLPGIEKIKKDIDGTRDLIIQIDRDKFPIEKISYNEEDGKLNVVVTPKGGQLTAENVNIVQGEFKFDLIFVLDTPDVDKLDCVYDRHTELFFETPIVNIDHHAGNEYFGTVNMVDLTATSTCEILVSIIESMGSNFFDDDVATCLLTGIISDTGSFKNINTTPKSLTISAQMLAAGARQQEIIQNLYKTRSLNTLKLWGKVLSRLEYDKDNRFVYSFVTYDDFKETSSSVEEVRIVLDELLSNTPGADVVLLLAEHEPSKVAGKLKGINGQDVLAIAEIFGGAGRAQSAGFDLVNTNLETAIPDVLNRIKKFRAVQLGRDKIEHVEKAPGLEIPKTEEEKKNIPQNHLPKPAAPEVEREIEKLDDKVEKITESVEIKPEVKELFERFVSAEVPVNNEVPIDEPKEIPGIDPIIQALESLEHEKIELDLEEPAADNGDTPNIDIADNMSEDTAFKSLGEIMREYKPGQDNDKTV